MQPAPEKHYRAIAEKMIRRHEAAMRANRAAQRTTVAKKAILQDTKTVLKATVVERKQIT